MDQIETKILNCDAVKEAEKNMVFVARLTQRGHTIHNMDDLLRLYNKAFQPDTVKGINSLPHPAVQKFTVITVAVVGASRRFLSQITRHQNEVKFMSASLQYSNYSGKAAFAIPYEIMMASPDIRSLYMKSCLLDMDCYESLCRAGISHDSAGYVTPQGLRNVLLISNVSSVRQTIKKDTRIGQLVITPVIIADFVLDLGTERGTGSFGSTGK